MPPSEASCDGAPALSPARLNLLCDCERCFWVRMQRGESRPKGAFPSVVSGVEREVRALFDRHREVGTLPPALRTARLDATLVDDESFLTACRAWQREPTVTDSDTAPGRAGPPARTGRRHVRPAGVQHPRIAARNGTSELPAPTGVLRPPAGGERPLDGAVRPAAVRLPDGRRLHHVRHRTPLGSPATRPATSTDAVSGADARGADPGRHRGL